MRYLYFRIVSVPLTPPMTPLNQVTFCQLISKSRTWKSTVSTLLHLTDYNINLKWANYSNCVQLKKKFVCLSVKSSRILLMRQRKFITFFLNVMKRQMKLYEPETGLQTVFALFPRTLNALSSDFWEVNDGGLLHMKTGWLPWWRRVSEALWTFGNKTTVAVEPRSLWCRVDV